MTLSFVVACIVKVTVVFAIAWLASVALRRSSAAVRHSVWAAAVLAALTLPALMWTLPEWRAKSVTVKPVWQEAQPVIVAGSPYAQMQAEVAARTAFAPVPTAKRESWTATEMLAVVWGVGVAAALLRLIAGLLRVRTIRATPLSVDAPRGVRVLRADSDSLMPLTWGLFRPRVLFPASVSAWPEERIHHVLAHELAHIERRDWIVHMAAEVMRAGYWFHPLAWLAVSQLRQEAERACDDIVLRGGANASDYAGHLVVLAQTLKSPAAVVSSTLAAARLSSFERRVNAMLNSSMNRRPLSRRALALIAIAALAVLGPLASLAPGQEVRGVVIEPGTNHPVADAEITVWKMGPPVLGEPMKRDEVAKLTTDAQGAFVFKGSDFGEYVLIASKEGYSPLSGNIMRDLPSSQVRVTLNKDNAAREVQFSLGRLATVIGRIVDADTDKPIEGFRLSVLRYNVVDGGIRTLGGVRTTDSQGMFRTEVQAGPHVIETRPQVWFEERFMADFTPEDIAKTDLDYRRRYFPGGAELSVSLPFEVPSGGLLDVGTIRVRKEPFFRVHVKTGGQCQPGDTVHLMDTMAYEGSRWSKEIGEIPCGRDFVLRNVEPGNYVLQARTGKTAAERLRATVPFSIRESNLVLSLTLDRPPILMGKVVASEGAGPLPLEKIRLLFRPLDTVPFQDDLQPVVVEAKGEFRFNMIRGRQQLIVSGIENQFYIKQVRYRGNPAPGGIFDFTGDGSLEIEIDSQPAAITGSVRVRDRAISGADVVLTRWPMIPAEDPSVTRHIRADDNGNFQVAGLAPGEYRIFAVRNEDRDWAEAPATWQRLISQGERLVLTRGASPSLTLAPVDPSR